MDLEQQLRAVLTDDRLEVLLGPGAVQAVHDGVRRRKRRNATLAAAASFVLVVGGITTGVLAAQGGSDRLSPGPDQPGRASHSPKPDQVKPPAQAPDEVPWAALPYDPAKPFALRGTSPQPGVPSCKASQLSLTALQFQGATGSAVGGLTVTNDGATCGLQGQPVLTGYGRNDNVVATSSPDDGFIVHPWFALKTGQQARTDVQIFGDGSRCLGPVKRLSVDLARGAGEMSADITWVDGRGVVPRCGSTDRSRQLDHYIASSGAWTRPDGTPRLPMSDFAADLGQQPTTAMQGTTIRYQVLLSTGGAEVKPCLPYREQVYAIDGTQTAYGTAYFRMNCADMSRSLTQGYTLDMQLALPNDIPVGTYALNWQTPIPGLGSGGSQTIQVTAAPRHCTIDQLSVTAGTSGAATTHYRQNIIIRNTSRQTCSLRGYPGIQFVGPDGSDMPTNVKWTATSFMWPPTQKETMSLGPNATVSFALGGSDYDPLKSQSCPTAAGIKVIPPGLSSQALVHVQWPYCFGGKVDASPVVAGTRGPR